MFRARDRAKSPEESGEEMPAKGRRPGALSVPGSGTLPAPSEGSTGRKAGAPKPCRANESVTAATTWSARPAGSSASIEPPNPPPVIRAPSAPASEAASTATSSSAQLTSKSSRRDACEANNSSPTSSTRPASSRSAARAVRPISLTT